MSRIHTYSFLVAFSVIMTYALLWMSVQHKLSVKPSALAIALEQPSSPRHAIKHIDNYAVYYGPSNVKALAGYDLIIIQPETLLPQEIASLKAQGTLVVAYLSVGEVETYRPWYTDERFDSAWILGLNENWGSYFVDTNQQSWRILMNDLTTEYITKGFDGVFLDTVDTVDLYPETVPGMVSLIQQLRENHPESLIIQNRGFSVLAKTVNFIDALMFEGLSTGYSFSNQTYFMADNSTLAKRLRTIQTQTSIQILSLDYVENKNDTNARRAIWIGRQYGFIPAVSEISLQSIPQYELLPTEILMAAPSITASHTIVEQQAVPELVVTVHNQGPGPAFDVTVSVLVGDSPLISQTYPELLPGQQQEWRLPWSMSHNNIDTKVDVLNITD